MRFVRKNAAAWGVDPAKLIASGGSSGGHLAACAAVLEGPDDAADDPAVSCKPQALVLFNPVLDCMAMLDHEPKRDWYLSLVSGNSQEQQKRGLAELSPFAQLRTACPPTIVFYGTEDKLLAAGRAFAQKSANLGGQIKVWEAPGVGHGFFNATPWHEATLIKVDQFLASLGFVKGPPTIPPADAAAVLA
jgi:acetyl esterase/lipase